MTSSNVAPAPPAPTHALADIIERLLAGEALLQDSPKNVTEVVGILHSYGIVLDAYSHNLIYIADHVFLNPFPFFKYFNGQVSWRRLWQHWQHDRINYEYAEYCMKGMFWHGGGGLDRYVDSAAFEQAARLAIAAYSRRNPPLQWFGKLFPEFPLEQVRQMAFYSGLGQFWRVMSDMFMALSDRYDRGEIKTIPDVVSHLLAALVADANRPITYCIEIQGKPYEIIPESAGLTFLMDTAVPYVEAIFFRGTPFPGTISYNAQAAQIPPVQGDFAYGALYADPLPIGGAGIPPTLLMQDMRHFLPDYLHQIYRNSLRQEEDLLVKICETFQKSMFCVTTAALQGLAPYPLTSVDPSERAANQQYLETWMDRFATSQLRTVNR